MVADRWLAGAELLIANWPYTLLCIMPTNNRLMASAGPAVRAMLDRWAALHAVRTLLGFAAVLTFLLASLS